jgi:hypothetical protein
MARVAGRMSTAARPARFPVMALALAALSAALCAPGCGRPVCPDGLRADPARSKAGETAFCRDASDPARAVWVQFYRGTERRQLCPFTGGRPGGTYQAFHPGGARWLEGRYESGRKIGRWIQWGPDGRKVAEGEYREGQLVEGAPVGFPASCETVSW